MSEFELNLFRQRSVEAIRQKARRGELRIPLPIGFLWSLSGKIEKDPDERVRQAAWTDNPRMDPFRGIHPASPDRADTQHEPPADR
jgi:hypothetical protein